MGKTKTVLISGAPDEKKSGKRSYEEKKRKKEEVRKKAEAEAKAYAISVMMEAFQKADPTTIQSLATVGMEPDTLIALAFQGLAEKADKIGQLNISPDLLRELLDQAK